MCTSRFVHPRAELSLALRRPREAMKAMMATARRFAGRCIAALLIAASGVWAGCAAPRFPAGPRQGGPVWTELTSEHFTVWTNADAAQVRALVRRMEHLRQAMLGILFPTAPTEGRALAIVVRNDQELIAINHRREPRPFVTAPGALWQPTIVMSLTSSGQRVLTHELVHLVSFPVIRNQPRWLAEGMATYFETMVLDQAGTTAVVGARTLRAKQRRWASVRALLAWRGAMGSMAEEQPLYNTAWALFGFLFASFPDAFARYLWLIDQIDPGRGSLEEQQQRAWTEAFAELPQHEVDDQLDRDVRDWLRYGRRHERLYKIARTDGPMTARRMSPADTHAVRALLLGGQPQRQHEIAEALAADPLNVLAWFLDPDELNVEQARALAAAHPDDWRAWVLLTEVASGGDPAELERARSRMCALMAQNPVLPVPVQCLDRGRRPAHAP